ncbi:MAG: response regulator transcription factor [Leptolinea sp.]|nr:response regulator transcription factor [Leptolinea sp.]
MIVDDHAMVRSGLRMFLMAFDDLVFAGEASSGNEAIKLVEKIQPDLVLMDLIMPGMDGLHATYELQKKNPAIKIIALTSFSDAQLIIDAIEAGVSGCLFKNTSANELANAIRAVMAGNTIFSPEVTQLLMSAGDLKNHPGYDLTSRELDVLQLMVDGKNNQEISQALTLSLSTIKFHVSNILSKMNAHNRGEAISIAIKHHLVDLSE